MPPDHSDFNDQEKNFDPNDASKNKGKGPDGSSTQTGQGTDFETAGPGKAADSAAGKTGAGMSPSPKRTEGSGGSRRPGFDKVHLALVQGLMAQPGFDPATLDRFLAILEQKANLILDRYPGYLS